MAFVFKDGAYMLKSSQQRYELLKTSDLFNQPDLQYAISNIDRFESEYTIISHDAPVAPTQLPCGSFRYVTGDYGAAQRLVPISRRDDLYVKPKTLDSLRSDIDSFISAKSVYERFKAIYRRGYLLYGNPGNGKTSLVRQLVSEFEGTAHIIWSSEVPDFRMCTALNEVDSLKIVVFEELVSPGIIHNMGRFLEFMDGESSIKNCITIATTNSPEQLASNLANRPSRFDVVAEIGNPDKATVVEVLKHWLAGIDVDADEIPENKLSFAQIKEVALLSQLHGISIKDACGRVLQQEDAFKASFTAVKKLGLGD